MKRIKVEDSLAVKDRPKKLSDLVGNNQTKSVLQGMFARRQLVKTYLLAGPAGSGKTTVGRLLGMIINCQNFDGKDPCLKCKSCRLALKDAHPDIMELNAGGEQGNVSELRSILQIATLAPVFNYKVFLCDEIQGMGWKARQEVLKPLEEPPPNTVWMLITTRPEKLSDALYSRGLKLFFNYPTVKDMSKKLYSLSKKEFKPKITKLLKPFLPTIVEGCGCQPRDSITAMESIAFSLYGRDYKNFSKKDVRKVVKKFLTVAGELDRYVIRFLAHLYSRKKLEPLVIAQKVEKVKIEKFISLCHLYSHYAALYYLHKRKGEKVDREGFWGVNFIKWNEVLDKIAPKTKQLEPLRMCSAATEALEKARLGVIPPEQSLLFMIQRFLS